MNRFNGYTATPQFARPMMAVSAAISESKGISPEIRDLIECRVSQLNGCSYCLRMHVKSYVEHSGDQEKLHMLPVWRVAKGFSDAERAALDWAEGLTETAPTEKLDKVYLKLQDHYDLEQISTLTFIISTINAWNRLGVAQHNLA